MPKSKPLSWYVILIPLVILMVCDLIFTLAGQPEGYWKDHTLYSEENPIAKILLKLGPMWFIGFFIIYIPTVLLIAFKFKNPYNFLFIMLLFMGHAWASASWVPGFLPVSIKYKDDIIPIPGWYSCMAYFFAISLISSFLYWLTSKLKRPPSDLT